MRIHIRVKPWISPTGYRSVALSALGFFDVAPSALEAEAPDHK